MGPQKRDEAMKLTGLRIAVLLVLQILWASTSHSEPPGSTISDEEVSKQGAIYQSRGEDVPKGYVIDRSLLSYTFVLPSEFKRSLADLGPKDRWLDIGAGEGRAILEVTCELKAEWSPPLEVYRIRKVCNDVTVPRLMPTHFEAGTPPERRFQLSAEKFGRN
jgi:hypothetical protein